MLTSAWPRNFRKGNAADAVGQIAFVLPFHVREICDQPRLYVAGAMFVIVIRRDAIVVCAFTIGHHAGFDSRPRRA